MSYPTSDQAGAVRIVNATFDVLSHFTSASQESLKMAKAELDRQVAQFRELEENSIIIHISNQIQNRLDNWDL